MFSVFKATLIVFAIASPIWLTLISSGAALLHGQAPQTPSLLFTILATLAALIAAFNVYLSFFRPFMYARKNHKSMVGYKYVSGVPLVSAVLVTVGVLVEWESLPASLIALAITLTDTGGPLWLILALTKDKSFWWPQS